MSRTTATIPDDLTDLVEGAVDAGVFENKSDAIRHVLRESGAWGSTVECWPRGRSLPSEFPIGAW